MRLLQLALSLFVFVTPGYAEQLPLSILDATGDVALVEPLAEGRILTSGDVLLILPGTPDMAAVILPDIETTPTGQLLLSGSQAEIIAGRIGLVLTAKDRNVQLRLSSPDRLEIDLDSGRQVTSIHFCLSSSQAWLTVTDSKTETTLQKSFPLAYDAEETCTPSDRK